MLAVAAAIGAAQWDHLRAPDALTRVAMCAAISGFAVVIGKSRQRREKQLRRMTVIAETAQRAVLRAMPSEIGDVGFAVRYVSASEKALVGGDLYDFAATPHGVRLIVGDVRGKGIDAVQLAAAVLGAFRQSAFRQSKLVDVAADLDALVSRVASDEDFVTALLAEFPDDGTVRLVNCGHHPPLLTAPGREPSPLDTREPASPLGMGPWPLPTQHTIPPGARLLFYTDGLVEARDDRGRFFPLGAVAAELAVGELDTALDGLLQHLGEHAGKRLNDDVALVLTEQRNPGAVRSRP
ncbi:MAG TPA: PP2C family protein-serine/threonine phosphatase [Mycobacteriales bacterium]|nr:PP2C family protein-serine/threonine phosphatase [Mycobacteriales bacterium]